MVRPWHVFLDLDGTLTDPAPGIIASFRYMARNMDRPGWDVADLEPFIGPPLREAIATILESDDADEIEQGVVRYREYYADRGMLENSVYAGVPEALSELRARGFILHLATSKPRSFAQRIVAHFALAEHLSGIYGAELDGSRSTKREILADGLAGAGADTARALMVGDRRHDLEGARAHGMAGLGVLWGYGAADELRAAGAHRLVEAVPGLPDAITSLTRGQTG